MALLVIPNWIHSIVACQEILKSLCLCIFTLDKGYSKHLTCDPFYVTERSVLCFRCDLLLAVYSLTMQWKNPLCLIHLTSIGILRTLASASNQLFRLFLTVFDYPFTLFISLTVCSFFPNFLNFHFEMDCPRFGMAMYVYLFWHQSTLDEPWIHDANSLSSCNIFPDKSQ